MVINSAYESDVSEKTFPIKTSLIHWRLPSLMKHASFFPCHEIACKSQVFVQQFQVLMLKPDVLYLVSQVAWWV